METTPRVQDKPGELPLYWKIAIPIIVVVVVVAIILIVGYVYNWGQPIVFSSATVITSGSRSSGSMPPIVPGLLLDGNHVLQQAVKFPYYDISGNKSFYVEIVANVQSLGILVSSFVQNAAGSQFFFQNTGDNTISGIRIGNDLNGPPGSVIIGAQTYGFAYDGVANRLSLFVGEAANLLAFENAVTNVIGPQGYALTIGCNYIDIGGIIRPQFVMKGVVYRFRFYGSPTRDPTKLQGDFSFAQGQTSFKNKVQGKNDIFTLVDLEEASVIINRK